MIQLRPCPASCHDKQVMTKIGATCLITIGVWVVIMLGVQFGHYKHECRGGEGERGRCLRGGGSDWG